MRVSLINIYFILTVRAIVRLCENPVLARKFGEKCDNLEPKDLDGARYNLQKTLIGDILG